MEQQDLQTRVRVLEGNVERIEKRVSRHGEEIDDLRLGREHDSVMLANIQATLLELKQGMEDTGVKIDGLTSSGSARWESVVNTIITGVVGALIVYVIWRLGLRP